jgi:3-hydroxybutyryl-CoA dehydrogenase
MRMDRGTIGVAGLGFLGRGIATCLLGHGFQVIAYTRSSATHAEARQHIATSIQDLIRRAGFSPKLADEWPGRYTAVASCSAFAPCDLVIESVVEDLATKQKIFDEIEASVRSEIPIASNTSALPISTLQQSRKHPGRFVGMHWAEPAHITRFLELIRGEQTSDEAFAAVADLARHIGKDVGLVQKDVPGFVVNRMGYAIYREALHLLESGVADAETIDRSFRNAVGLWATICGPLRWIDLTGGPALYGRAMQGVLPTLSNAEELPRTLRELMASDAYGTANGRGFYQYTEEEAQEWERLFVEHAWTVHRLMNQYFPQDGR